ncbi:hypothetical protein JCM16816_24220 [Thermoanaerobacter brockii subsp. lactiethylicus]|jgi:Sec-independent protein translocase protein TatA|uniref:Uncharacterized protein n=2 Tax=Thermoanaerobacter TaxID=1754 RepID=B0KAY1_THEP3|nr:MULTISPECIES: hypothetical protein [Thermoanaerobacter]SFE28447.1 hypothetical protein SAMN04324257_01204 [Thermoanaerobacter thermohydrosulfuricus]ABY92041.1 hypothetical protein Teth514_0734 [Thermoanaerobacter sp. X514]ABY93752.1 hypothetical protein Teth39_0079 [Thermoanaerobacter pseudethanolicus ATCC 33223]ADV78716.1 hypothetical protein Thebr_0084 [Thermoanaerobacter brockii subsp. finnii Ako-1]HBW58978.1 hypothetical protein [Thermoanaerobacter sp.]
MKDKKYSFRIRENDEDIEEILSRLSSNERSEFIRSAIRFYAEFKSKLDDIDNKLEEILKKLETKSESLSVSPSVSQSNNEENQKTDETEKLLIESVMDLLSL